MQRDTHTYVTESERERERELSGCCQEAQASAVISGGDTVCSVIQCRNAHSEVYSRVFALSTVSEACSGHRVLQELPGGPELCLVVESKGMKGVVLELLPAQKGVSAQGAGQTTVASYKKACESSLCGAATAKDGTPGFSSAGTKQPVPPPGSACSQFWQHLAFCSKGERPSRKSRGMAELMASLHGLTPEPACALSTLGSWIPVWHPA